MRSPAAFLPDGPAPRRSCRCRWCRRARRSPAWRGMVCVETGNIAETRAGSFLLKPPLAAGPWIFPFLDRQNERKSQDDWQARLGLTVTPMLLALADEVIE
jgi:hypothetical protein